MKPIATMRHQGKAGLAFWFAVLAVALALAFSAVATVGVQQASAAEGLFTPRWSSGTSPKYIDVYVRQPVAGQTVRDVCSWGTGTWTVGNGKGGETTVDSGTNKVLFLRESWGELTENGYVLMTANSKFVAGHRYRYSCYVLAKDVAQYNNWRPIDLSDYEFNVCMPNRDEVTWYRYEGPADYGETLGGWDGEAQWSFTSMFECASPMSGMTDLGNLDIDLSSDGFEVFNGRDVDWNAVANTMQILNANGIIGTEVGTDFNDVDTLYIDPERWGIRYLQMRDDGMMKAFVTLQDGESLSFGVPSLVLKPDDGMLFGNSYYGSVGIQMPSEYIDPDHGMLTLDLTSGKATLDPSTNLLFYGWLSIMYGHFDRTGGLPGGMSFDFDFDGTYDVSYGLNPSDGTGTVTRLSTCSLPMGYVCAMSESDLAVAQDGSWPHYSSIRFGKSLRSGWHKDSGLWYYLVDDNGTLASGWQKVGKSWYYFDPGTKAMKTGWLKLGKTWYYLAPTKQSSSVAQGAMVTGWQMIGGIWYWFNSSGAMATGWQKVGSTWYWFDSNGAMKTGWVKISGKYYHFASSGAMDVGWLKDGGSWYYLQGSGAMATGWLKVGGTWYYFFGSGKMATGTVSIGGKTYRFASNGAWVG